MFRALVPELSQVVPVDTSSVVSSAPKEPQLVLHHLSEPFREMEKSINQSSARFLPRSSVCSSEAAIRQRSVHLTKC
jgi:hypothetical protein